MIKEGKNKFINKKTGIVTCLFFLAQLTSLSQTPTCLDIRGDTINLLQDNKTTICILYSEPICSACIALLSQTFDTLEKDSSVNYFLVFPWINSVFIRKQYVIYTQTKFNQFTPCFISNPDSISYYLNIKTVPSIIIYQKNSEILYYKNEALFYEKKNYLYIKQDVLKIIGNL